MDTNTPEYGPALSVDPIQLTLAQIQYQVNKVDAKHDSKWLDWAKDDASNHKWALWTTILVTIFFSVLGVIMVAFGLWVGVGLTAVSTVLQSTLLFFKG